VAGFERIFINTNAKQHIWWAKYKMDRNVRRIRSNERLKREKTPKKM
jgi:hypothetical protein